MKKLKDCLRSAGLLALILFATAVSSLAQVTPSADAYTNSASAGTNFGTAVTLGTVTSATSIQKSYIQFDLSSIPAGFNGSNIAKATLKLYVNSVTTAGSFNVDYVTGPWAEKTITANLSPSLGTTVVGNVPLNTALAHDYVLVDVTPAVVAWLNKTQANDGLALVANSPLNATFDSKENTTQSHAPELDMVFTGGLSGATLTTGGGLAGGVNGGVLNVGMLRTCSTKQVLQWNGTAWVCSAAGAGTITGVTAGPGLTGGGTSGAVTLNLDTVSTDARYAKLAGANVFTFPQAISSNNPIVSPLVVTGSASGTTAIFGHSTDTGASVSYGVLGVSEGTNSVGVWGASNGASGYGVQGAGAKNGVLGWSGSVSSLWNSYTNIGTHGDTGLRNGFGVLGTADDGFAGWFQNTGLTWPALVVIKQSVAGLPLIEADGVGVALVLDTSGNLAIAGNMSKAGGSFKIDHPLDPSGKYLYHSFVESPDMMNIYNGTAILDAKGKAAVTLPDWFEALNRDFRYQLTAIGAPGPNLYISKKVVGNRFEIAGGQPNAEVSWQVTGVRHDAWADAHRIPVEVKKTGEEAGKYLHPDLFGMDPKKFGMQSAASLRHALAAKRPSN